MSIGSIEDLAECVADEEQLVVSKGAVEGGHGQRYPNISCLIAR
jgi:hypothetical protein